MSKIVITFPHLYLLLEIHAGGKRIDTMFCTHKISLLVDLTALKLVASGITWYHTTFEANVLIGNMAQLLASHAKEHNETQP